MGGQEERLSLLLIEDDEAVANMYRLTLEQDGYSVRVALDGTTGLEAATKMPPDLIFLDLRLPDLDGLTVLERLRENGSTRYTPVVIMSSYGEDELRSRGLELGALEYVIKSQTTPTLIAGRVRAWASSEDLEAEQIRGELS